MTDRRDFNPETDIEFTVVQKLAKNSNKPSGMVNNNEEITSSSNNLNVTNTTNVTATTTSIPATNIKIIFFDFNDQYFSSFTTEIKNPLQFQVVKDLTQLTQSLKNVIKSSTYLFLNYEINMKAMDQLIPQLNAKFPTVFICIALKNNTLESELRRKFSYIKAFLSLPLTESSLMNVLK